MGTIFDDNKGARDLHFLASFINLIKLMGVDNAIIAVEKLNEFINAGNSIPVTDDPDL